MKLIAILCMYGVALSGCASMQYAGITKVTTTPYTDSKGIASCCAVTVISGKEYSTITAHASKSADGSIVLDLNETGTKAFAGQQIAAGAAQNAANDAVKAALITGGVLIAPVGAPVLGAIGASGTLGALGLGAVGATVVNKVATPAPVAP